MKKYRKFAIASLAFAMIGFSAIQIQARDRDVYTEEDYILVIELGITLEQAAKLNQSNSDSYTATDDLWKVKSDSYTATDDLWKVMSDGYTATDDLWKVKGNGFYEGWPYDGFYEGSPAEK